MALPVTKKRKVGVNAMKRVHLPTPWLFEPAERPDDRTDYCLDCSFLPQWNHRVLVFTLEWSGVRTVVRLGPVSWATSNADLIPVPKGKSEFRSRVLRSACWLARGLRPRVHILQYVLFVRVMLEQCLLGDVMPKFFR